MCNGRELKRPLEYLCWWIGVSVTGMISGVVKGEVGVYILVNFCPIGNVRELRRPLGSLC